MRIEVRKPPGGLADLAVLHLDSMKLFKAINIISFLMVAERRSIILPITL
jgi:hypothetical protein